MDRAKKRNSSRAELRAKRWIESQVPERVGYSGVKDVKEGTFFVKRQIDLERSDSRILPLIYELGQAYPALDLLKIFSVSIIGPGDGNKLQNIARETDGTLHLGRIQEKVQTDFSEELVVKLGGAACFGASRTQKGKRFIGYYLDSKGERNIYEERFGVFDLYETDLAEKKRSPHFSIASTTDQIQTDQALGFLKEADIRGAKIVLEPAEFSYAYFRNG